MPDLEATFETLVDAFVFLDRNKDGYVSKSEMVEAINETTSGERSSGQIAMKRFGNLCVCVHARAHIYMYMHAHDIDKLIYSLYVISHTYVHRKLASLRWFLVAHMLVNLNSVCIYICLFIFWSILKLVKT